MSEVLLIISICCFVFMIVQNVYFLVYAIYRSKKEGIVNKKMKSNIFSSAIFSLLPAFSVSLTLIPLSQSLGKELVFIRSIFTGSVQDNILAAETILNIFNLDLSNSIISPNVLVTVLWGTSLSGVAGLVLIVFLSLKNNKQKNDFKEPVAEQKKAKCALIEILSMSFKRFGKLLYIGIIGVYFVKQIAAEGSAEVVGDGAGFLSLVTVMLSGGFVLLFLKLGDKSIWLKNLAVPISMLLTFVIIMLLSLIIPESVVNFEWRN